MNVRYVSTSTAVTDINYFLTSMNLQVLIPWSISFILCRDGTLKYVSGYF